MSLPETLVDDLDAQSVTLGEFNEATSPRVCEFVIDLYENARGSQPDVFAAKGGDVGVLLRTRYEGGMVGRDVFEVIDRHGFQISELNTGSGRMLVQDRVALEGER